MRFTDAVVEVMALVPRRVLAFDFINDERFSAVAKDDDVDDDVLLVAETSGVSCLNFPFLDNEETAIDDDDDNDHSCVV